MLKFNILKKEKGITIVSLTTTIIILLILAGISLIAVNINNGIITNASKAKFMTEIQDIQEKIEIKEVTENKGIKFQFGSLENLIARKDIYNKILSIENGKLVYNAEEVNEKQLKWLQEMNIPAKENIIPIYNEEQFKKIGSGENIKIDQYTYVFALNAKYQLQNNINLECSEGNQWIAIGNESNPFSGILDGNNYIVSGLYISNSDINQGIFASISGTIKNIIIKESYVSSDAGRAYIGILAGKSTSNSQIINCINYGKVESTNSVGGLIGENHGTISGCINKGEIVGIHADIGGIAGSNNSGQIIGCENSGNISDGTGCRGGIVGINYSGTVSKCINNGELFGQASGGIVGCNAGKIEESYNNGITRYGGICQTNENNGSVINCYNMQENKGTNIWAAGITGQNKGIIKNCYNLGKAINGLLGNNTGTMENCYYLSGISTKMQIDSSTGIATNSGEKTEKEMKNDDFVKQLNENTSILIWLKDEKIINNGYPILYWEKNKH